AILNGTIFREPILIDSIPRLIPNWKEPIIVGRHGFGDQVWLSSVHRPGKIELVYTAHSGREERLEVCNLASSADTQTAVAMAMFNTTESITGFAHSCFQYALLKKYPLFLSTKNTILKVYDNAFKSVFETLYHAKYKALFDAKGISFEHRLIDDMVAQCVKGSGGFLWACKNYDGDVQSDIVAQGFGSLGLMSSVLYDPTGDICESEAAHGTVTRHYREHMKGRETSTNSVASIFAWTRGLSHRAKLDSNEELAAFCNALEKATIDTIQVDRKMTKDLAICIHGNTVSTNQYCNTWEFIDSVAARLRAVCEWTSSHL
ncbi:isocitrate dehydrogenase NADP-dependent, partial [Mitosporidium daphniae]